MGHHVEIIVQDGQISETGPIYRGEYILTRWLDKEHDFSIDRRLQEEIDKVEKEP